jgi:hypothetical protein
MNAIILTDGKAGHENQSKAFARALGCEAEIVPVSFKSKLHKTFSYLLDRIGVRTLCLYNPFEASKSADVVIGTGSGVFYAVKSLAKSLGIKCGVVLYPRGYDIASFDCVMAPSFDSPKKAKNVVEIPANLVASDEAFYQRGVEAFREKYSPGPGNAVAVIVGGPNKCSTMTAEWMREQLNAIFDANKGCEMWVTTSRRTPPDVEAVVDSFPWNYRLIYSRDHFNPIPAFVKLADRLYVTAESTGMLSEACTFGEAEVIPLDNLNPGGHKFRRFVEGLQAAGYANGRRKIDLSAQFASAKRLLGL